MVLSARSFFSAIVLPFFAIGTSPLLAAEVFYGTQTGKVYHNNIDCSSGKKIQEENKVTFTSAADAEGQGRRLCRMCERLSAKKQQPQKPPETKPPPPAGPTSRPSRKIAASKPAVDPAYLVRIKSVLPGGTLVLDTQEKARLLGICLPQNGQACCDEAGLCLEGQHRAKKCVIAWDEPGKPPLRDCYGRLLFFLQLMNGGPDFGSSLLTQGFAWVDWDHPCSKKAEYLDLEYQAWVANLGIWKRLDGAAGLEKVQTGRHARQYHPMHCTHHAHLIEPVTITINEAKARRLVPCENYRLPGKSRDIRERKD